LRDTIAWSYALLSGDEQTLFRRMGVCAGGCSFKAAEVLSDMDRVTTNGGPGGNAANRPTLNILAGLLDHSLIRAEEGPDGSTRFTMLETIREYALEQLEATGELARVRASYFGYLLAQFAPLQFDIWRGARQVWALAQVGIELHNLRGALAWSIAPDHGDALAARTLGLQLAAAIASYWVWRGPLSEGCEWFEHLLNGGEAPADARAACMCGACLVFGFVDPPRAIAYGEQSVAFYRQEGDAIALAEALHCLGRALRQAGQAGQAWVAGQEALALFRANDVANSTGWVLLLLGDCAQSQADFQRALVLLEEALLFSRKAGDAIGEGYTLANLGRCAHALGQHEQALVLLEQGVTILERLGAPGGPEGVRESLAYVLAALGRGEQAAVLLADTLQFWWERGSRFHLPALFDGIAVIAAYRHDARQAARLFGAAQSIRVNLAVAVLQAVAVDRERGIAAARATLGHEAFEACWEQGYRAPVADIVVEAIQYTDTVQPIGVAGG
jgi:tetratricopeptide (TPR) repeat protein